MNAWLCRFFAACVTALSLFISAPSSAAVAFRAAASAALTSTTGPVTYRAAGTADINDGASITPGLPAGTVAGDLLILITEVSGSNSSIATPAGWTLLQQANNGVGGPNGASGAVFYRIAPAAPTAPVVTNPTINRTLFGRIIGFYNVDQSTPIGASGIQLTTNSNITNAPAVAGGPAYQSMLVITSHVDDDCTSPGTPGLGWTQAFSSANTTGEDSHIAAHYITQTGTGTQGARSLTRTGSCTNDDSFGVQFVINGTPANLTIAVPSGTVSGDVMLASVTAGPSGTLFTQPSGWTLMSNTTQSNSPTSTLYTYWKIAGASEPASYTWTIAGTASTGVVGGILSFSGVDNAVPINTNQASATGLSLTHIAPSVTTTEANTMLVTVHEFSSSTSNWTPPAGMTEALDVASGTRPATTGTSMEMNYQAIAAAGATGTRSAVAAAAGTDTGYGITHTIALAAAVPTTSIADYRMDQTTWNGTANEVTDSSGNGYHGKAAYANGSGPTASTSNTSPAYTNGMQSTCRYGVFDQTTAPVHTYTYLELSSFPSLSGKFTFGGWIRSTDVSSTGQRILVNDDAQNGWGLSLGDGAAGSVRLFNRNISNTGTVTGDGTNPSCGVFCLDTTAVITNNAWYYVAATVHSPTNTISVYVFNAAGTRIAKVTGNYSGTWANGGGLTAIGGETASSGEGTTTAFHFKGNIDEVQVLSPALSETDLAAQATRTRNCTGIDHVELVHDGSAITCTPKAMIVLGCTTAAACYGVGINQVAVPFTITPSATNGAQWCVDNACVTPITGTISVNNGDTLYVRKTSTGTTQLSGSSSASNSALQCYNTSTNTLNSGVACEMTYVSAGFIISTTTTGAAATLPSQIAGVTSGSYYLRAVKTNTTTKACEAALSGDNTVGFAYECNNNPSTCAGSNLMGVTGRQATATTISRNDNGSVSAYTSVDVTFDANGNAPFTFNYADVGAVKLWAKKTASGALATDLTGSSNSFVVKPYDFGLSAIQCGSVNNPAAVDASGGKFCAAGNTFSITATARTASGATTPSFGRCNSSGDTTCAAANETVALAHTLVAPVAPPPPPPPIITVSNGTLGGTTAVNASTFVAGTGSYTFSNLTWDEVGIINIKASNGNYLSNGLAACAPAQTPGGACQGTYGSSGNIGRFYPHHFKIVLTPQPGCSAFIYGGRGDVASTILGQPFSATVTAQNATSGTTTNYSNALNFAKNVDLSLSAGGGVGKLYVDSVQGGSNAIPASKFSAGIGTVNYNDASGKISYVFNTSPTGPTSLTVHADNADAATSVGTDAIIEARFGRLRLSNTFGSERQVLEMPLQLQYWSGLTWVLNSADNCTALTTGNFYLSSALTTASAVAFNNGNGTLTLQPPGAGNTGSIDIAANLGVTGSDQSCLTPATNHGGTAALKPWLRSINGNCANTYDRDPSARATFGIYAPETRRTIHVRELFN